jgi:hypothetical protein
MSKDSEISGYIEDLVTIRELRSQDVNFIVDSFISCLNKYTKTITKGLAPEYSNKYLEKIILHALQKENYSTFVCVNKDNDDEIYGYIIGDSSTNHIFFNYTKYIFRPFNLQSTFLMPLIIGRDQPFTTNWPTKEALKSVTNSTRKCDIKNLFLEEFL